MNDVQVSDELDEQDASAESVPADLRASTRVQKQPGKAVDYRDAAKRLMERCITDARQNVARLDRDRQDWQNLLFQRGGQNQWSVYDRATNSYVPRGSDPEQGGLPEWVPRPVTNIYAVKTDGICSLLNQSEPAKQWSPSTDDDRDRAAAEVADDADPVLLDEIGYDQIRPQLNKLAVLTNGGLLTLHFDNDPRHGMEEIPVLRCPACGVETMPSELDDAGGVCPGAEGAPDACGAPADAFEPVIGSDGKPFGIPYPRGRIVGTVATSFEWSIPSTARTTDTTKLPWVLTHSGMAVEDIVARWPNARGVIDKNTKSGTRQGGGALAKAYARAMRQLSAPARANAPVAAAGGGVNAQGDEPIVFILHHDPIDDGEFYFPDGLFAAMCEDRLLEAGPLPFADDEDVPFKSCLIRRFAQSPGTAFSKPPADDLVPLQISRNLVDSLIQLILMHNAAPTTYIPLSVTLETEPTGEPGQFVYYRSTVPGDQPRTEQGTPPPEALFKYLELIDSKFEEVSKLNSVLAGARPEGDPTLGEVQILQERGMAAFKEPFDELVWFDQHVSRQLMWIAKQTAWAKRFRQVRGENGEWDVRQFTAADLTGKIDVQIEKASAWPKSHMMKMLQVDKALKEGILPPPMQDPELQTKLLLEYGLIDLKPSLNVDRKQIARELDRWKQARVPGDIQPPNAKRQSLPLHLFFKQAFLKTEEYEDLARANPAVAQAMEDHVAQIQTLLQQQQQQAVAAQQPPPQAPPDKPDGRTPVQKGDRSALEAAVQSGALTPAGGQQKPDVLGAALGAGVLQPAGAARAAAAPPPSAPGPSIDDLMAAGVMAPAPPEMQAPPPA